MIFVQNNNIFHQQTHPNVTFEVFVLKKSKNLFYFND